MKQLIIFFGMGLGAIFTGFKTMQHHPSTRRLPDSNPFSHPSALPYQAPPFDKIKNEDFKPALEAGIEEQLAEINQIADNPATADFKNTLEALEKSGQLLTRVNNVFRLVTGANTNPGLQHLQEEIAPRLASLQNSIFLNSRLFRRVEAVYENRQSLDPESKRLSEYYYQQFVLAGGKLSDADKDMLKKYNEEEASLSARFGNQLLGAAKTAALLISDSNELKGASPADLENYAHYAGNNHQPDKYQIPVVNTTQQPALRFLSVRDTRKKLFQASWNRAEQNDSNDTRSVIVRIASLRAKKARLAGYPDYATWKLQDQMAQHPKAVSDFFAGFTPAITAKAKQEATDIQAVINEQKGGFSLEPWDWNYYAEQVRKARYNVDEKDIKPYFELNKVLEDGVFYAAGQLYGISFKERHDIPVYQQDVRVFEVFDNNGKPMALFYCDYFKRDNKSGGAWMDNLVAQSFLLGTMPVIYNVCNFSKPSPGNPALISFDDVTTMFHEFGHALHGLFANQRYPSLSGTNTARDFVEFPSQFNEHWAVDPTILKNYAVHYLTGRPIPPALVEKMKKASNFNAGYALTEAIEGSLLDMQWHLISADTVITDVDVFEQNALYNSGLYFEKVPPRYRSTYFLHIWSNGYAAGYYAYQWTKMLEEDAFSWFEKNGGLTRANGQRFRDLILSKGSTEDYNEMFERFTGHAPDSKPLQRMLGLENK